MHSTNPVELKRWALLTASGVVILAALPVAGLRFCAASQPGAKIYPRGRGLSGFLIALACFTAATGAFNPFFNAFFATRLHMGVERIGVVFSCSNLVQVVAVLCAPAVFRRLGDVKGIAWTQMATGAALALMAFTPSGGAAAIYVGYMSLQYMSEPALLNLLMSRVTPAERGGSSALYFLMTSLVGGLAAFVGGAAISRAGYQPVLVASGLVAMMAALFFRKLVREED
jgi:predicted MFS family arabinose efflux permease